jgi:hypothetical protein
LRRFTESHWVDFGELDYQVQDLSRIAVFSSRFWIAPRERHQNGLLQTLNGLAEISFLALSKATFFGNGRQFTQDLTYLILASFLPVLFVGYVMEIENRIKPITT